MHFEHLYIGKARDSDGESLGFSSGDQTLRRWTLLEDLPRNSELVNAIGLICCGRILPDFKELLRSFDTNQ